MKNLAEIMYEVRDAGSTQKQIEVLKKYKHDSLFTLLRLSFSDKTEKLDKEPIYKIDEKTFCFKSKSILSTVSFVFDPTIPKGQIKIEKTYKYEKYANGLVIKTRQYNNKSENRIVLKKDKG